MHAKPVSRRRRVRPRRPRVSSGDDGAHKLLRADVRVDDRRVDRLARRLKHRGRVPHASASLGRRRCRRDAHRHHGIIYDAARRPRARRSRTGWTPASPRTTSPSRGGTSSSPSDRTRTASRGGGRPGTTSATPGRRRASWAPSTSRRAPGTCRRTSSAIQIRARGSSRRRGSGTTRSRTTTSRRCGAEPSRDSGRREEAPRARVVYDIL